MKAIRIHDYGTFEQLKYEDVPVPEIKDDQILVKVYTTSVNHLDMKKASGEAKDTMPIQLPWIPGHDFAGTVEKTGKKVTGFEVGDKVYGNSDGNSYAEYLAADISKVVLKPESLDFAEASSVPHVGETAWQAIHTHGQLKSGQKVLIHGAAGAVGAFAVQFAKLAGAKIYATASTEDIDLVKSLGAGTVIDYKTTDFTTVAEDIDLVLVLVGGNTQEKSYNVIKQGGRLVSTTGPILEDLARDHKVTGVSMVIKQSAKDLQSITDLINEGKIQTDIALTYPLSEAATGWKVLSGKDSSLPHVTHGKIVLEVTK
ncbi:NADP-dependent oxidoreductase [Prevotella sp. 10(H)]|uniref:NADP-dependent oxidoreductase n=1 Tax=Prevotella sp. 10(H) TaxID=1158294 RepID=UPI0004A6FD50|nr:NADP-dependent oxidoreductase [Prevotella sp. 10(H)]